MGTDKGFVFGMKSLQVVYQTACIGKRTPTAFMITDKGRLFGVEMHVHCQIPCP